jgi:tripartite-type tricarboxylate transporter receptor subunit TctC
MAGRAQFFMAPIANAVNPVKEGKLVALGVSSGQRDPLLPGVPTIAEAGVPGYHPVLWYGLLASVKTPRPIIVLLNREITRILVQPEVRARWIALGLEPKATTPAAFDGLIAREIAMFARTTHAARIKVH